MNGFLGNNDHVVCSIEHITTNKKIKEIKLKEITAIICALLNSNGGRVVLDINSQESSENRLPSSQVSTLIRILEQTIISIIGIQLTVSNIQFKEDKETIVILVQKVDSLITTNYNFYLPSQTQVVQLPAIEPLERINDIINRKIIPQVIVLGSHQKIFLKDKNSGSEQSKIGQFKCLKSQPSKRTTLADRITGKGNKFSCYVSAFANYSGGHIYYGITDDGFVEGELIPSADDRNEITKKVQKAINKMIWPKQVGPPKRGVHWEIFFEPVLDVNSKPIPSTFVIVIYIAPCLGGVFTEEPECYEMVEGKVEKMSFATWKKRTFGPVQLNCSERHTGHCDSQGSEFTEESDCYGTEEKAVERMWLSRKKEILQSAEIFQLHKIPSTVHRTTWSSTKTRKICCKLNHKLNQSINYGESILPISTNVEKSFPGLVEVKLVVLFKNMMVCHRSNCFRKAQVLLKEYDDLLPKATEVGIFRAVRVYIKADSHRAQGEVEALKQILPDALYNAEQTDPGLISSAIYLLAATATSLFNATVGDQKGKHQEYSSYLLPIRALEHLQYVQDSPIERADLEQKTHIILALLYLGCDRSGVLTKEYVDDKSLEKAKFSVTAVIKSIGDGHPMNYYREVQFKLVKSILSYRYFQVQVQDDRKLFFLKEAFKFSKNAETLASECLHFDEMLNWARACMALYTEGLVRLHFERLKSRSSDVAGMITSDSKLTPKATTSEGPPNDD